MAKPDGGPAFPRTMTTKTVEAHEGMALRDWFAGQALASMGKLLPDVWNEHDCGRIAYVIADAMIKARD